ncbi:glycosyltransferase family 2 protein [Clostridium sp.]|uniref:glycosyltransferase family 2 protein n=1 Tax=Clostridium sp. TaxID=1506 RepID=UPI002912070C|nr:glycosyltransferase family 2 protein [Clostridium sp.]MDU7239946.1 glycosyltransferase family 2 protein [Clostridium sp.]
MKISLAMIVKNEAEVLEDCLGSVKNLVDEIIVVDTGSQDGTIEVARKMGAKVYEFRWCNDFSMARNFAAGKCIGDWILVLDADEVVNIGEKQDLIDFAINNPSCIGRIKIESKFIDGNEISSSTEYVSRFYPKGLMYKGCIHEQLESLYTRKNINLEVIHSGYFNKDKSKRNLDLLLKELESNGNDNYILYQIARTLHVAKRYEEADMYFEKCYKNIKFNYSYSKSFINLYINNLVNINKFDIGLNIIEKYYNQYSNDADFNFSCGIFYMNLILSNVMEYGQYLYLIEESYLKCLEIGSTANEIVRGVGSFKAAYNLGVFYETTGNLDKAKYYYKVSYNEGYKTAKDRFEKIKDK